MTEPPRPNEPARLTPMGIGQVLEVAARIVRRRYGVLLVLSLLFVGPAALLTSAVGGTFEETARDILGPGAGLFEVDTPVLSTADAERLAGALGAFLLATAIAGAITTIGALGSSRVVGDDHADRPSDVGTVLRACLGGALRVLGLVVVTSLIVILIVLGGAIVAITALAIMGGDPTSGGPGVFLALIVGVAVVVAVVYLTLRWAVAIPAIALEGAGVADALRRSWHLTTDNLWRTLLVLVIASLVAAILSALVATLLAIVVEPAADALGLDGRIALDLVGAAATVVFAPLVPVAMAVLYHDLIVRRDSWDPPPSVSDQR